LFQFYSKQKLCIALASAQREMRPEKSAPKRRHANDGEQAFDEIERQRQSLPVYAVRNEIVQAIKSSPVLIIVGETGSGKTTQIAQFLLEGLGGGGIIACTQPRRVAALTVAQRVAQERQCILGEEVGYTVRFDDCTSKQTRLKYMTDGMLLREALLDPLLRRYSTILLDEAHERTIATDILLGLLKAAREKRKGSFRLVIMSATLDVGGYQRFFPNSKAVYIKGRQHKVDVFYLSEPQESYLDALVAAALQLHEEEEEGDILGFLTGQEEIEIAQRLIAERSNPLNESDQHGSRNKGKLHIIPMYAALAPDKQLLAFKAVPKGDRKIVLSTNIAETSITIPGIRYVIDPGFVKSRSYNPGLGADLLQVLPISKAQAWQRTGRAGREGPGKCFRLFTEDAFMSLRDVAEPEIQRANLSSVVLQLKSMDIQDPLTFDFMDPPPKASLLRALELLYGLQALDSSGKLTDLGRELARLPVDPMFARSIIISTKMGCLNQIIAIVAMVSCDATVFVTPSTAKQESRQAHSRFFSPFGDHQTLLAVYQSWKSIPSKQRRAWCKENYINARALTKAHDIFSQLLQQCARLTPPNTSEDLAGECDPREVRRALVSGLFPHAARRQHNGSYRVIATGLEVKLHPSSVLHSKAPECIVFNEVTKTTRNYVRGITKIESSWLPELAPFYFSAGQ
jgi:ATP-dependent RNA helicase DHX8/PRP22